MRAMPTTLLTDIFNCYVCCCFCCWERERVSFLWSRYSLYDSGTTVKSSNHITNDNFCLSFKTNDSHCARKRINAAIISWCETARQIQCKINEHDSSTSCVCVRASAKRVRPLKSEALFFGTNVCIQIKYYCCFAFHHTTCQLRSYTYTTWPQYTILQWLEFNMLNVSFVFFAHYELTLTIHSLHCQMIKNTVYADRQRKDSMRTKWKLINQNYIFISDSLVVCVCIIFVKIRKLGARSLSSI